MSGLPNGASGTFRGWTSLLGSNADEAYLLAAVQGLSPVELGKGDDSAFEVGIAHATTPIVAAYLFQQWPCMQHHTAFGDVSASAQRLSILPC